MKKKLISTLLCIVTVLSLIGCGSPKSKDTASVSSSTSTEEKETKKEVKEESKVLFEDEYAKVTYLKTDREDAMGPQINIEIENKGDKDIVIQTRDVSIDGYMVDPVFSSEVLKGKKAKEKISFLGQDIDKNFKAVEGKFAVINKESYETMKEEPFKITY